MLYQNGILIKLIYMASLEQLGKMDLLQKNRDSEPRDREVHSLRSSILDGQKSKKKKKQV
jgi:hypothetical protein